MHLLTLLIFTLVLRSDKRITDGSIRASLEFPKPRVSLCAKAAVTLCLHLCDHPTQSSRAFYSSAFASYASQPSLIANSAPIFRVNDTVPQTPTSVVRYDHIPYDYTSTGILRNCNGFPGRIEERCGCLIANVYGLCGERHRGRGTDGDGAISLSPSNDQARLDRMTSGEDEEVVRGGRRCSGLSVGNSGYRRDDTHPSRIR